MRKILVTKDIINRFMQEKKVARGQKNEKKK